MKTDNIFDTDKLQLYVKKIKTQQVINNYSIFGWELKKTEANTRYEDINDLTFTRAHKIKNKDELQLQQIYMEENLNDQAKLDKYKNSLTLILSLSFGVFALFFILSGISFILNSLTTLTLVFSIICFTLTLLFILIEIILIPKIHKKMKKKYNEKKLKLEMELKEILNKASTLVGGNNEK